jgi:putative flippase GtrA
VTRRLAAFVAIGGLGFVVQLTALDWLARNGWGPLLATLAAVELAVIHNFCWHERWTWGDRAARAEDLWKRLGRYHAAASVTTLGNVIVTMLFVRAGVSLVGANILAVGTMSAVNFLLSDRWTFARIEPSGFDDRLDRHAGALEARPEAGGQLGSAQCVTVHAQGLHAERNHGPVRRNDGVLLNHP